MYRKSILIVFIAVGMTFSSLIAQNGQSSSESGIKLSPLWSTQVDERWKPGENIGNADDGITAEFVEFSQDGKWLVTANGLGNTFVLDARDGKIVKQFTYITYQEISEISEFNISGGRMKGMETECGAFTPDNRYLILGGNLNGIKVFDLESDSMVRHINVDEEVDGLSISADGRFFAHAAEKSARVWDLSSWQSLARVTHGNEKGVINSIDFTSDAKFMASAGNYGHVILTRTRDWQQKGDGLIEKLSSIKSVRFSPDDRYIAAGYGGSSCVAVFDTEDMSLFQFYPLFYIEAVAWSPDGRYLFAGGRDGKGRLRICDTRTWELAGDPEVQADGSNIEYIDFYGDLVAIAGEDAHVRLYRLDSK